MRYGVFSFNLRIADEEANLGVNLRVGHDGYVDGLGGDDYMSIREWLVDAGVVHWMSTGPEDTELFLTQEWMDRTRQHREAVRQGFDGGPWHERGPL